MRPDALPVRPLAARAVLPPDAVATLFGARSTLRPSATVEVVRRGAVMARVAVATGPTVSLWADATHAIEGSVSLRGPVGTVGAIRAQAVRSRLVLPDGLRRAWGVADAATVALGPVAVGVPVESGPEAGLEAEQALWLAAGRPETARWLPGVDLAPAPDAEAPGAGVAVIERRVVTETDVRQARLRHQRIRLSPGQIVTPAARALGREVGVFEE